VFFDVLADGSTVETAWKNLPCCGPKTHRLVPVMPKHLNMPVVEISPK